MAFAIEPTDSTVQIVDAINYLLANQGTASVLVGGNVVTANTASGQISSTTSSGVTTVLSYIYPYINVRYSDSSDGAINFSSSPTGRSYFGVRNSLTSVASSSPADYFWTQVTGGFGSSKYLFYSVTGGRQVVWFAGEFAPAATYAQTPDGVAINLDVITTAPADLALNVNAYFLGNSAPATPSGGYYNFNTFNLIAPSGWSNVIPSTSSTQVYVSQTLFSGNNTSNVSPKTSWSTPSLYISQFNGNTGPAGSRGFLPLAYVITATDPTGYSDAQFTTAFSASRSAASPPIGVGYAPIANDTAQFFWANAFNSSQNVTTVRSFTGNTWTPVDAQVVSGSVIYPGTITANTLNVNNLYTITIQSTNATLGNTASPGYWLQASDGSARFGGNTSIGNNLSVGANANIGSNLYVGNNATIGSNAAIGNNLTVGANASIGGNLTVGNNAFIGNNTTIGANLTVLGLITQGALGARVVTTTSIIEGAITGNLIQANTITGNLIQAGSITADKLSVGALTVGNITSIGATFNSNTSAGYWLNNVSGAVRFGGNTSIGNNLSVGANAVIGGNLIIGSSAVIGANLTVTGLITAGTVNSSLITTDNLVVNSATKTISVSDDQAVNEITFVNGDTSITSSNYLWPYNTRGFGVGGGATIIPTTTGSLYGSSIIVNYNAYLNTGGNAAVQNYNLIELWKTGADSYYPLSFNRVVVSDNIGSSENFIVVGSMGNIMVMTNASSNTAATLGSLNQAYTYNAVTFAYLAVSSTTNLITAIYGTKSNCYSINGATNAIAPRSTTTISPLVKINGAVDYPVYISSTGPNVRTPTILVGSDGYIINDSGTGPALSNQNVQETRVTFADLRDVASNLPRNTFAATNGNILSERNITTVSVGTGGTILYNTRSYFGNNAASRTNSGWTVVNTGTIFNFNGIANNKDLSSGITLWVAVGDNGIIYTSANGSSGWTQRTSPTTKNLNAVTFCPALIGGVNYWVAVGDNGTIITSTNGTTWTGPVSNPAGGGRHLYTVAAGYVSGTFIAGGQSILLRCPGNPASAGWSSTPFNQTSSVNTALTRLQYYGSWANVANVTQPPSEQMLSNRQSISGSYVDYNFTAGSPVTYYLVLGNMFGNANVYTGGPSITVTEYKR